MKKRFDIYKPVAKLEWLWLNNGLIVDWYPYWEKSEPRIINLSDKIIN